MTTGTGEKERAAAPAGRRRRLSFVPVTVAFVAIAAGFFVSTLYGELRASEIDREVALIATNALPSVGHLVAAQSALRHLEVATDEYSDWTGEARRRASRDIDDARADVAHHLAAESATAMYPGEADLTAAAAESLLDLDVLLAKMFELTAIDPALTQAYLERDVRPGIDRADASLDRLLSLNAAAASVEATRISGIRTSATRLALGLDAVCIAFAALAALLTLRALRRQRAAEEAHGALLEVRADELELFAKRVAHDLLSPLSALSFTLSSVKRNAERGLSLDEPLARAGACLKRSQRLVDGVLDFARSAASPGAGQRTSLREAIDDVLDEVRSEVEGGAEEVPELLVLPWEGEIVVACAPGIFASCLSNLVRNAVKYLGEGNGERRVTVRVEPADGAVRVEVEDTGPGLPPGLEANVFEPYVRAPDNAKPGLGLGLATVRRFVEAHGGHVGVRPAPGHGCAFWFELPCAPAYARVAGARHPEIPIGNGVTGR